MWEEYNRQVYTDDTLEDRTVAENETEKDLEKSEKEEVQPIKGEDESVELSEEELEDVAGGFRGGDPSN
jgi:hypothetical protein